VKLHLLIPVLTLTVSVFTNTVLAGGDDDTPTAPIAAAPIAVSHYDCGDKGEVSVTWWEGRIEAIVGNEVWKLPQARSGSGARYSDGAREIWEHQGVLRVTDGDAPAMECPIIKEK